MFHSSRCCSSACGIVHFVQVHPVRLHVSRPRAEEEIVGTDRRDAVALLRGPRRIALTRVDHGFRQVVGERYRASGANRPRRRRGIGRGGRRVRIERRDRGRAVERVAVGRPMKLHRLIDDAGARRRRGVHEQVGVRQRGRGIGQAEQPRQQLGGPHRDEVAAAGHPVGEHRHLRRRQRRLAENHDVVGAQRGAGDRREIGGRERVQSFTAQDLRVVSAERVRGRRHDEHRAARALRRRRRRRRRRRERPGEVRGHGVARRVLHSRPDDPRVAASRTRATTTGRWSQYWWPPYT